MKIKNCILSLSVLTLLGVGTIFTNDDVNVVVQAQESLAYTKNKTITVFLDFGELYPSVPLHRYYNDGQYSGTLFFVSMDRRPGWGGHKYAWYATYSGVVSTGGHITQYLEEVGGYE